MKLNEIKSKRFNQKKKEKEWVEVLVLVKEKLVVEE